MPQDNISAEAITRDLGTRLIGREVLYYPTLSSTMTVAGEQARKGAAEGTVVLAEEQTAGRGRMNRAWLAPGGNIALSLILYPDLSSLPSLIMVASLAVVGGIAAATGLKPRIKWPNDVLINGKKVCGILIENSLQGEAVNYTIIGIGINVNLRPADFPEIQPMATSLADELGREVSRLEVVRSLLVEMDRLYLSVVSGGSVYELWRDNMITLGRQVRVTEGETLYQGVAESVAPDGSLLLRGGDGKLTRIVVGDVTLRD